jgi:hypothetical protein
MMMKEPPEGRYKAIQKKVKEEVSSKDKNKTNMVYYFEISEGDFTGKELRQWCTLSHDIGHAQMLEIHCALNNIDINSENFVPEEFDNEEDNGKECVIEVVNEMYNGNKTAKIAMFLPSTVSLDTPF